MGLTLLYDMKDTSIEQKPNSKSNLEDENVDNKK